VIVAPLLIVAVAKSGNCHARVSAVVLFVAVVASVVAVVPQATVVGAPPFDAQDAMARFGSVAEKARPAAMAVPARKYRFNGQRLLAKNCDPISVLGETRRKEASPLLNRRFRRACIALPRFIRSSQQQAAVTGRAKAIRAIIAELKTDWVQTSLGKTPAASTKLRGQLPGYRPNHFTFCKFYCAGTAGKVSIPIPVSGNNFWLLR
jgi:hypothetical protein